MKAVIQCAGDKKAEAGYMRTQDGEPVYFVARPAHAPADGRYYAHPDAPSDTGPTWRDLLRQYNEANSSNPLGLLAATELYSNPVYSRLAHSLGTQRVYILSAGWGLVRGDFRLPRYDITFRQQAEPYKRRLPGDRYRDFRMLDSGTEPVLFFVSDAYRAFCRQLTSDLHAQTIVFHRSEAQSGFASCGMIYHCTRTRTNWHYECADAFLSGVYDSDIARALGR